MPDIGIPELLIILVVILLLFGPGRIGKMGGELGRGIREFRQGLQGDPSAKAKAKSEEQPPMEADSQPVQVVEPVVESEIKASSDPVK